MYIGDMESLTASAPTPEFFAANPDYMQELRRRFRLINGGGIAGLVFTRERSRKYYQGGLQHRDDRASASKSTRGGCLAAKESTPLRRGRGPITAGSRELD